MNNKRKMSLAFSAFMFGLVAQSASAQSGYTINGNVSGWQSKYVYMTYRDGEMSKVDSVANNNGKFTFTGNAKEPFLAIIAASSKAQRGDVINLYVENSKISVTGSSNDLEKVTINGSATQKDADALKDLSKQIQTQEQSAYAKYQEAAQNNDTVNQKLYEAQLDSLDNVNTQNIKQFVKDHPNSFLSLSILPSISYGMDYSEINGMFSGLNTTLKNSPEGKKFAEHLAVLEKTQVGKPAINFTQNDTTNKPVSLSDFKGKYVLVDFWASWCGPCRAENPNVVKAYNKYKDKNFEILGVSLDQKADRWKAAIVKDNLTWTEVSDLQFWKNAAAAQYGVQAIPANFLIDPNGVIIGHDLRGDDLEKKLSEVLK